MRLNWMRWALCAAALAPLPVVAGNWPSWRGDVAGSGITAERDLPLEWGPERNVRWRVALPERGNSTAIVWGERVFVTQPIEKEGRRTLICFHRADGRILWTKEVIHTGRERTHESNPYCSASPVTDGERVIVSHGSAGLWCYDMEGRELWHRDLGPLDHTWGNASSPVLHGELCYHYHGPTVTGARLVALDRRTGEIAWSFDEPKWVTGDRTDGFKGKSDGLVGTWSTPIVVGPPGGREELVMSLPVEVRSFDPRSGKELWRCGGLNPLIYTSPIYGEGIVVAMGGFYGNSLAVRPGGAGDVTAGARVWHEVRSKVGIGSGVILDGHIYYPLSSRTAVCLELATGRVVWEEKIRAEGARQGCWSSMVLAGDKIYMPLQNGDTAVLRASPKFEQLALNRLGEMTNSSLAISDGEIFLRTHAALWCISEKRGR